MVKTSLTIDDCGRGPCRRPNRIEPKADAEGCGGSRGVPRGQADESFRGASGSRIGGLAAPSPADRRPARPDLASAPAQGVAVVPGLHGQEGIPGAEGLFDPERHPGGRTALRLTRSEAAGPRSTTLASRAILSFLFELHGREER